MTISQGVSDVRRRLRPGLAGMIAMLGAVSFSVANVGAQAAQVGTILVDTAANDTAYTVSLNGVSISITSDASATKPEIAAALAAAINASPYVRGVVSATSDGVDTVTVTGLWPGVSFTLTDADGNLTTTAAATAAAAAESVPFGRLVVADGFDADEGNDRTGGLARASRFTAQVASGVVTYAASFLYHVTVTYEGIVYAVDVPANTDAGTTAGLIRTALTTALAALPLTVGGATDTFTITADTAGDEFLVGVNGNVALTDTRDADTSINLAAIGVAAHRYDEEIAAVAGTSAEYPANVTMQAVRRGAVWVDSTESPTAADPVYVDLSAGATAGRFYTAAGTDRVKLAHARWIRDANAPDDLALLAVDFPIA